MQHLSTHSSWSSHSVRRSRPFQFLTPFPGTDRRFERIAQHLYSDYGHHQKEIAATLQLAREIAPHITLVYQPHQNVRQHEGYR